MATTRFESKTIEVKNLTVEEVKRQIIDFYNSLPAVYNKGGDDQLTISKTGSDLIIEYARPIVLVPGITSISRLTVNIKELGGNKQTYVVCPDFPGIKAIHFWMQYLPTESGKGTITRLVCDIDIAWYNPVGRVIQNLIERYKDTVNNEISKVSDKIEQELNKQFAPKKEEVEAENA